MPDNKQKCRSCKNRHLPPTGKKCQYKSVQSDEESSKGLRDAAVASNSLATDQGNLDGQQIQLQILEQLKQMSQRLDITAQSSSINLWNSIRKVEYRYCFFKFSQKM